jgi:hypothetical protein
MQVLQNPLKNVDARPFASSDRVSLIYFSFGAVYSPEGAKWVTRVLFAQYISSPTTIYDPNSDLLVWILCVVCLHACICDRITRIWVWVCICVCVYVYLFVAIVIHNATECTLLPPRSRLQYIGYRRESPRSLGLATPNPFFITSLEHRTISDDPATDSCKCVCAQVSVSMCVCVCVCAYICLKRLVVLPARLEAILLTWRIGQNDFTEFKQQQTSCGDARSPLGPPEVEVLNRTSKKIWNGSFH